MAVVDGIPVAFVGPGGVDQLWRPGVFLYEEREYQHRRTHTMPPGGMPPVKGDGICTFCHQSHHFGTPCPQRPRSAYGTMSVQPTTQRGRMARKDLDQLVTMLERRGITVVQAGKHRKVLHPETGKPVVTIASTPGDRRTVDNTIRDLRKAGIITHDPRKEGQMAAVPKGYTPPTRQREVLAMVDRVLEDGGLSRAEFAKHLYDVAKARGVRPFKSAAGAQWQVYSLSKHEVPKWALDNIEAAVVDLIQAPAKAKIEAVPEKEVPRDRRTDSTRTPPAPEWLIVRVNEIMDEIVEGLGLKRRESRKTPYGLGPMVGSMTIRAAKRHGIPLEVHSRGKKGSISEESAIGNRVRDLAQGMGSWESTREATEAFVTDWDKGHRIRPEDMSERVANMVGTIPEHLRDKSLLEGKQVVVPMRDEALRVEPIEEYERIDVGKLVGETPTGPEPDDALGHYEEKVKQLVARMEVTTDIKESALVVPIGWEDGDMPLHLRVIATAVGSRFPRREDLDEIMEVARAVMLTELRAG